MILGNLETCFIWVLENGCLYNYLQIASLPPLLHSSQRMAYGLVIRLLDKPSTLNAAGWFCGLQTRDPVLISSLWFRTCYSECSMRKVCLIRNAGSCLSSCVLTRKVFEGGQVSVNLHRFYTAIRESQIIHLQ